MSTTKLYFGEHIKAARELKGYSQQEFADLLGMKRPYLSALENDHAPVCLKVIEKIEQLTGVNVYYKAYVTREKNNATEALTQRVERLEKVVSQMTAALEAAAAMEARSEQAH